MNEILQQLGDSHCHLNPECTQEDIDKLATILNDLQFPQYFFHIMTTNHIDLFLLDSLLEKLDKPDIIVPYFGVHPWFSHLFYIDEPETEPEFKNQHYSKIMVPPPSESLLETLPEPISITQHITKIQEIIKKTPNLVYGIGEIGIDKLFRIPSNGFYGNLKYPCDQSNPLAPNRVIMSHQIAIFQQFLQLANDSQKQVSLHCVKGHGVLFNEVVKYKEIKYILLHSYTGSIDMVKTWLKKYNTRVYFSFSNYINGEKFEMLEKILQLLPIGQILTETDMPIDKYFNCDNSQGYYMQLQGIFEKIAKLKSIDTKEIHENMIHSICI
ncbi:putative deoxyribonuclease [Spathaspora sp. JA1]|nr:putative deoxyribonuclease [Spathaspora sp. JA1]